MPATDPALPQTEDQVRLMLAVHRVAQERVPPHVRHRLTRFLADYDDAVILLRQDAPTAYRTAWMAMRRRETRSQERMA